MTALPAAILFDLDDTILRYTAAADESWKILVLRYAPRVAGTDASELARAIDDTRDWFWSSPERHREGRLDLRAARRRIVRRAFESLGLPQSDLADELADEFTRAREELVRPFPGAVETLHALRANGVRLGLVTNGQSFFQRGKIERFSLEPLFDAIAIEEEFGVGKPDPSVFHHVLGALRVSPQQAWMVGDNLDLDIRPAGALGLHTIWVDHAETGGPQGGVHPDRTVAAISELSP